MLDADGRDAVLAIMRSHGDRATTTSARRRSREALEPLRTLGLDAALMIHEDGATPEEAQAFIEKLGRARPSRRQQSVRFVTDPTWRAYVITYSAGGELCPRLRSGRPGALQAAADASTCASASCSPPHG